MLEGGPWKVAPLCKPCRAAVEIESSRDCFVIGKDYLAGSRIFMKVEMMPTEQVAYAAGQGLTKIISVMMMAKMIMMTG